MNGRTVDVVITGAVAVSPQLADDTDLLAPQRITSPTGFDPRALLGGRGLRYKDRATLLGLVAAQRVLAESSLLDDGSALTIPGRSVGVVASSNLGNLDTVCRNAERIATRSVIDVSPMDLPNASSNVVASSIAVRFGLRGPNMMVTNGESSGLDAMWLATTLIRAGRASCVIVIGVEPANDVVRQFTGQSAALFDGAAAVLLESSEHAEQRGAQAYAQLGRFARRGSGHQSVRYAIGDGDVRIGLWLAGDAARGNASIDFTPRHDLESAWGAASGALGVLQAVAGTRWLAGGGAGPVLATAGTSTDGVSSLLLTHPQPTCGARNPLLAQEGM